MFCGTSTIGLFLLSNTLPNTSHSVALPNNILKSLHNKLDSILKTKYITIVFVNLVCLFNKERIFKEVYCNMNVKMH